MRLPPHDADAERALLGGILRDPDVLPAVLKVISPDDLFMDCHQKAMRVVCELVGDQVPLDLVTVHDRLRLRRWLADLGGTGYLAELWQAVPTGANAVYHARIVREHAASRALIHAANEVLRDARDRVCPADELAEQAVRVFAEIRTRYGRGT